MSKDYKKIQKKKQDSLFGGKEINRNKRLVSKRKDSALYLQVSKEDILKYLKRGAFFDLNIAKKLKVELNSSVFEHTDFLLVSRGSLGAKKNEILVEIEINNEEKFFL